MWRALWGLWVAPAAFAAGDGTLRAPLRLPLPLPMRVTAGDFNRDRRLDLATVDGQDTVTVLIQSPSSRERWDRTSFPLTGTSHYLGYIRAMDLDADGDDDLVAAGPLHGTRVLLSKGEGSFESAIELGGHPSWVTSGDWDGDRKLDLATASFDSSAGVSVYLGRGDGTFALGDSYPTGIRGPAHDIEALDYDGDGVLDLMAKLSDTGLLPFRGTGDGSFEPFPLIDNVGTGGLVFTGDFNNDGKGDVAVQCCGAGISLGDGAFQKTLGFPAPGHLAIADLNRDGNQDLALVSYLTDMLEVYLGAGDGTFLLPVEFVATGEAGVGYLDAGDLDGDGHADLVLADANASSLTVVWGKAGSRFLEAGYPLEGLSPIRDLAIADLDRDSRPDLFLPSPDQAKVLVHLRPGLSGSSAPSVVIETSAIYSSLNAVDLDGDAVPDLAGTSLASGTALVALLDASGRVRRESSIPVGLAPARVEAGRLDEGEVLDLAVACAGSDHVAILLGLGGGAFGSARIVPTIRRPRDLALGDLDADGRGDIAVSSSEGLAIHHGEGGGRFSERALPRQDAAASFVSVADLDGDRAGDIVALYGSTVLVFHGSASRVYEAPRSFQLDLEPVSLVLADLDGNGLPDITTANGGLIPFREDATRQSFSVIINQGSRSFAGPVEYSLGSLPVGHRVEDLDLDGALDVLVFSPSSMVVFPGRPRSPSPGLFRRGSVLGERRIGLSDAVALLSWLFRGGIVLPCEDAADLNDDGRVNVSDPLALLFWLYLGGKPPPLPGPERCGPDPTADDLAECGPGC